MKIKLPSKVLSALQLVDYLTAATMEAGPQEIGFFESYRGHEKHVGPAWCCPLEWVMPGIACGWTLYPFRPGTWDPRTKLPSEGWLAQPRELAEGKLHAHLLIDHQLNGRTRDPHRWWAVHRAAAQIQDLNAHMIFNGEWEDRLNDAAYWQDTCAAYLDSAEPFIAPFELAIIGLDREIRAAGFTFKSFPGLASGNGWSLAYADKRLRPWLEGLITGTRTLAEAKNLFRAVLAETAREYRRTTRDSHTEAA